MGDQDHPGKARNLKPLDVNGPNFDCEAYFVKLLKEENLESLIKKEHQLTQEVRSLDQEMQTLVYENYNKFITATDTIRKMNQDFVLMEKEMSRLADSVSRITDSSKRVGESLKARRQDVQRLAKASGTLKHLESVINLPQTLQNYIQQQKDHVGAVRAYLRARPVLERLKDEPSFRSIYAECSSAMVEAKDQLKDAFRSRTSTSKELATNVGLLLQLDELPEDVADEFISTARDRLSAQLDSMDNAISSNVETSGLIDTSLPEYPISASTNSDILEFVDSECSQFLGDVCLMVNTGRQLFPRLGDALMEAPVDALMARFFACVKKRFALEPDPIGEGELLVRAMDRFYRRVHAANQVLAVGGDRYEATVRELIGELAIGRVDATAEQLQTRLEKSFMDLRQRIASIRHMGYSMGLQVSGGGQQLDPHSAVSGGSSKTAENANQPLSDALSKLEQSLVIGLKSALAHVLQMTASAELSWVSASGPQFLHRYVDAVRLKVFVKFFQRTAEMGERLCGGGGGVSVSSGAGSSLLLTMAKLCQNLATSTVGYVMDLCEKQFQVFTHQRSPSPAPREKRTDGAGPPVGELEELLRAAGRKLLEEFVTAEGFGISQMLVKSMETRDWLGGLEPRAIRPVMKRVVEDLTAIDWRVAQLFEEGNRRDRSSESSRRTSALAGSSARAMASSARLFVQSSSGVVDPTVAALSKKMWTERIDYVTSADFTRVSIMTGIIKICLKTFLESARLRTFGKFGLQHIQIDCHYLQLHLWRFVSDENIVSTLLEEILSSATRRCLEPVLMEPSVVDAICERG